MVFSVPQTQGSTRKNTNTSRSDFFEDCTNIILGGNFQGIELLNKNCKKTIADSTWKVIKNPISYYLFQIAKTGGIPEIPFTKNNPEPLGSEF